MLSNGVGTQTSQFSATLLRSQTGDMMRCRYNGLTKVKVNTRSSTELIRLDDYIAKVMWTRQTLDDQGYRCRGKKITNTITHHLAGGECKTNQG
jgi:hypothetical protein